jgi:hypothetical protein
MAELRRTPYVWVTWLARLMDDGYQPRCQWSVWFRSRYHYSKLETFPEEHLDMWRKVHNDMVNAERDRLEILGYKVFCELDNQFQIIFPSGAILSGKPDIVAVKGDTALVVDCKTGIELDMHQYQLLIYMFFLPHAAKPYSNIPMSGVLCYQGKRVEVPRDRLDESFQRRVRSLLATVVGPNEPDRRPHPWECRFCNIPQSECPVRNDGLGSEPVPFTMWDL